MYAKKEETYLAYISKNNSNREKQVILLMIPNGNGCKRSKTLAKQAKSEGCKAKSARPQAKSEGHEAMPEGWR